ncbi:MAG: hypothetical protein HYV29_01810 [Ignavibacteriales bacterium]|nr:hypothetical protein [Ignavibacteriales bacterium]
MMKSKNIKAWVVSADMGYGHQRAVFPLNGIAEEGLITAGRNDNSTEKEKKQWQRLLNVYESFSRARGIPVIGKPLFAMLDSLMHIPSFYPIRNLSHSTYQVDLLEKNIENGLCTGILDKIAAKQLPFITSFYAPAIAADMKGYEPIYCVICDADINRVWVAKQAWESRINYFAPCGKAAQRLKSYGVPEERIFLTGFPLPLDLLGKNLATLTADLGQRLFYLDPQHRFRTRHGKNVEHFLGKKNCQFKNERRLTITYAVGGAGAQKEIGGRIAHSLRHRLRGNEIRLNLVAGVRSDVRDYFEKVKEELHTENISVIYAKRLHDYFQSFNEAMHTTDILWTKPSELSFYTGLGIPIIMTPTIGAQERFNRQWLFEIHAGMKQENPDFTDQWLTDLLDNGTLADMAWSGFLKARKLGTPKILEVLKTGTMTRSHSPLER